MKNNNSYLLSVVALFFGAFCMYVYIQKNPIVQEKDSTGESIVKNVNVTENGISSGIENVYDSVVVVENYQKLKLAGIGSGFIYDSKGYILTNHHVIDGASEIKVKLMDGETLVATVIGSDEYADIAVIKIDSSYVKRVAKIGNSSKMKVGDTVFTIGSPLSVDYAGTVTRGILSGKDRMVAVSVGNSSTNDWIMNVMQTDAAINPGNSGGPLINQSGQVVGINTLKISSGEGIGFAIPSKSFKSLITSFSNKINYEIPHLGVYGFDNEIATYHGKNNLGKGFYVMDISNDSPLNLVGMNKGSVIVGINDKTISNALDLKDELYKSSAGERMKIEYVQDGKKFSGVLILT